MARARSTRSNRRSSSNGKERSTSNGTRSGKELPDYSVMDPEDIEQAVDVYVDAPVVNVDEIKFELGVQGLGQGAGQGVQGVGQGAQQAAQGLGQGGGGR